MEDMDPCIDPHVIEKCVDFDFLRFVNYEK